MSPTLPLPPARRATRLAGGFTLIELLVVVAIIGLLVAYVAPRYFSQIGKSEVNAARAQMDAFGKALDAYRIDLGRYPSSEQGLAALTAAASENPRYRGPYLSKAVPLDPWSRPYNYRSPGQHGEYDLWSYGRDGQPGGSGDDADLVSWR
jgi:general secretion pathway protein G